MEEKEKRYLYGRIQKRDGSGDEESETDKLVIYTRPRIFSHIHLSSLEGIFISDESKLERNNRLSWFVPQLYFRKDRMDHMEKKYNGKFVPFEE